MPESYSLYFSCTLSYVILPTILLGVVSYFRGELGETQKLNKLIHGLPWWLNGKESTCQPRRCSFNPWVRKTPLEKKVTTHSTILAWSISWTEEPGGLRSTGLQSTRLSMHVHTSDMSETPFFLTLGSILL